MAREAYGEFTAELRRTDVISDSFKQALRLRVQAIEREAYDRGFADGRYAARVAPLLSGPSSAEADREASCSG